MKRKKKRVVGDLGGGGFIQLTPEERESVSQLASAVHSLKQDIDDGFDPFSASSVKLRIEYDLFASRFDAWIAGGESEFNEAWVISEPDAHRQFAAEYAAFRKRFVAQGGKPTSDVVTTNRSVDSALVQVLFVAAVIWLLAKR